MNDLKQYLAEKKELVDRELDHLLPQPAGLEKSVCEAMRYSVFAGGKRIRPILVFAAFEVCGGADAVVLPAACSIEMVHAYSLIHDDLPALDNGQFRRGQPTVHRKFGEAIAILAGDGLLTIAFETLSRCPSDLVAQLVAELAGASGTAGMIGGQVADIEWTGKELTVPALEYIHSHKTGALITAAVRMGAILAHADEAALKELTGYGRSLGLAFQIADDIINVESPAEISGKDAGTDAEQGKPTYPKVFGVSQSRQQCQGLLNQAKKHLAPFGPRAAVLAAIADFIGARNM
ncbi:MAG: polyprenyl synthetase family protein [Candidatus Abyssobacteria bacterium SURF_5]|uniref:Polyprenyl synthetase family protein n=1 Tax=Abyssobacteria bacterium (strain SURF_5) TaxID=2093360 RepID=A0A3A4PD22_ABYX5|nr:MAG: polyprenyl synthetase family protein [Candidatus Abyssubacteria bacterium SURF_5]